MPAKLKLRPLREILREATSGLDVDGYLYLPEDKDWSLETLGVIIDEGALDEKDLTEDGASRLALKQGLAQTLESAAVEDIMTVCLRFDVPITDEILFDSFMYYWVHDAFMPQPGAYDPNYIPPSAEEMQLSVDRSYYDDLGEERSDATCEKEGCSRGALQFRIFCKIHHFEMMQKRSCPFKH